MGSDNFVRNRCPFNVLIMNTSIKITQAISLLVDENLLLIREKKEIQSIKIEPQLTALLFALIQHKNEMLTKQHLIDLVWEGNVFVGNNALRKNIYKLRALIKEHPLASELSIVTIPKKGYKLMVSSDKKSHLGSPKKWMIYAAASVILLLAALRIFTEDNTDFTKGKKMLVQENVEVEEVFYE